MSSGSKWDVNDAKEAVKEEQSEDRGEEKEKRKLTGQIMWRLRGHYDWLFVRLKQGREVIEFLAKE